jgi:hypothetical protein
MLTEKLDVIEQMIVSNHKPQYFTLTLRSDGIPRLNKITLEEYFNNGARNQ